MIPKRYFVIYSQSETNNSGEASYWSNSQGWVDLQTATVFEGKETRQVDLPLAHNGDAEWKQLPPCVMIDPRWEDEDG